MIEAGRSSRLKHICAACLRVGCKGRKDTTPLTGRRVRDSQWPPPRHAMMTCAAEATGSSRSTHVELIFDRWSIFCRLCFQYTNASRRNCSSFSSRFQGSRLKRLIGIYKAERVSGHICGGCSSGDDYHSRSTSPKSLHQLR